MAETCREGHEVPTLNSKKEEKYSCSSGFGNHLARHLDARGVRVLATCTTQKGAEQLEKVTSERLTTTVLDVSSTESVAAATEWVKEQVGNKGLWGLVNNAGIGVPSGPNEWLTKDDFAKVINVNLLGLIDVTLHMLPLVRRARGRVVNISSVHGRVATFGGGYVPSKFGAEAFSDTLRRELHPFGIKVSIVEPGAFKTAVLSKSAESYELLWSRLPPDLKECYGKQFFEQCCKIAKNLSMTASDNLHLVTNCIEHALTSCSPRTRYSAGWDAKLFYLPLSYLPTSITDFIMICIWPKPAQAV
ncbi:retinol dehydrogenase 16-like [Lacerta agilis]|uniref:retinol dehydrogenase 16-like n=1 Tax=Lacerta agilis TaxID=80427 RepID=UPI00141A66A8|nr:retinol dehydrogenase 16-like [Lacerta agilis]